jgi:hypothetical protein
MDRYAAVHATLSGPGPLRPTAQEIIRDEGLEGKWPDKAVLLPGVSSGLGIETAPFLAATCATLYKLTARNSTKARTALGCLADLGEQS